MLPDIKNTQDFKREMKAIGYTEREISAFIIGTRRWAKSDESNHNYAYPSLFIHRLKTIFWRTNDTDRATVLEWYADENWLKEPINKDEELKKAKALNEAYYLVLMEVVTRFPDIKPYVEYMLSLAQRWSEKNYEIINSFLEVGRHIGEVESEAPITGEEVADVRE